MPRCGALHVPSARSRQLATVAAALLLAAGSAGAPAPQVASCSSGCRVDAQHSPAAPGAGATVQQRLADVDGAALLQHGFGQAARGERRAAETEAGSKPPPFRKGSRIAVIGAGAGGVHMASRLHQLGYRAVTVFERTRRVGGKCYTDYLREPGEKGEYCKQQLGTKPPTVGSTSCVRFEEGAVLLTPSYQHIRSLCQQYGLQWQRQDLFNTSAVLTPLNVLTSLSISEYIIGSVVFLQASGKVRVPGWTQKPSFSVLAPVAALVDAAFRYTELHRSILGTYNFSMPARPRPENLRAIDMTMDDFLTKNGLQALVSVFELLQSSVGYGRLRTTPALYLLWFCTPQLVGSIMVAVAAQLESTTDLHALGRYPPARGFLGQLKELTRGQPFDWVVAVLPAGFQTLWERMAKQDKLDIRLNTEIMAHGIRRNAHPGMPIEVTYRQRKPFAEWTSERFDFLIYAAPHAAAHKYVADLSEQEQRIFGDLSSFVLATTLYRSDAVPRYSAVPGAKEVMFAPLTVSDPRADGAWHADSFPAALFRPAGSLGNSHQWRTSYQFVAAPCRYDRALCDADRVAEAGPTPFEPVPKLQRQLVQDLRANGVKGSIKVRKQLPWPYFPAHSQAGIQGGLPWDLRDLQGARSTWWVGGSASFDSLLDVVNYNLMLLDEELGADFLGDGANYQNLLAQDMR